MRLLFSLFTLLTTSLCAADLTTATIFSDGMVLQRGEPVAIWGTAKPAIPVSVSFAGQTVTGNSDVSGKWRVALPALSASATPGQITITAKAETVQINNVLVGEVWICAGQSNMALPLGFYNRPAKTATYQPLVESIDAEIKTANDPLLRQFAVTPDMSPFAERTVGKGNWITAGPPPQVQGFSATGYFFGKELREKLNVPVGLVITAFSGTRIEAWLPRDGISQIPALQKRLDVELPILQKRTSEWDQAAADAKFAADLAAWEAAGSQGHRPHKQNSPDKNPQFYSTLFNAMVNPIAGYGARGFTWYQGESNGIGAQKGGEYATLLESMIQSWRGRWGKPEMPFYFAQLANWDGPAEWMPVCDSQRRVASRVPHTGMAVLNDLGENDDVHPHNKADVGKRLSLWALQNQYGQPVPAVSGPLYRSHEVKAGSITVHFDHIGSGMLVAKKHLLDPPTPVDTPIPHFELSGAEGKWHPAIAEIASPDSLVVKSDAVLVPHHVRYAWEPTIEGPLLYNKEGLPASPFTTEASEAELKLRN